MKAKLIVVGGTTSTAEVNLRLPTVIGRGRNVQVTIPHSLVSRQHCEISEVDGRLVVRDLGSMNGTYIGDERITEAVLEPGALLTVGTVTFRAAYEIRREGESQSDDASQQDESEGNGGANSFTSRGGSTVITEQESNTDFETVPVSSVLCTDTPDSPQLPDEGETTIEKGMQSTPDRSDVSSLEAAAKNSD